MSIEIHSNNIVTLDGRFAGRVNRTTCGNGRGHTVFFTASGEVRETGYDVPHQIDAPTYVASQPGSVSNWTINPAFEAAVREIVGA